ncbi:MAG: ComF family protein [Candidatus Korobacteraceae bacterium]
MRVEPRVSLVAPFHKVVSSLSAVFFPSDCRLCHTPLVSFTRLPVCPECLDALAPIRLAQCVLCGERLAPAQLLIGNGQCQACCEYPPNFDRAISYGEYDAGLRDLIHLLKYDGVLPAAKPLGKLLAESIAQLRLSDVDAIVVPVPLHSSKRRERRFNQADLIARAALEHLPPQFALDRDVLVRQRPTRSQVGLDREARIQNMHGAFRVIAPQRIKGRTVVVVDDVMTTGTTVSECARVLKRAGAEKVFAATVARTLKHANAASFSKVTEGEEVEAAQLASV